MISPERSVSNGAGDESTLGSIRDLIRWGASRFNEHGLHFGQGTDNALDEAAWLVLHALHLPPDLSAGWLEAAVTPTERTAVIELLERRIRERRPAAYLTREAWFAGLPFYVDERVLVPRSPIAELIERHFAPWIDAGGPLDVLEVGTGSGCIAIAIAMALPQARVTAVDVSTDALAVARINVEGHGLGERVELLQSDLYSALGGRRFDLIVANPPYVDAPEMAAMAPEYGYEPALGLAAGEDGLDVVLPLLAQAEAHLAPGGWLIGEVGASEPALGRALAELPLVWIDLQRGGAGVFAVSREDLAAQHRQLQASLEARRPDRGRAHG